MNAGPSGGIATSDPQLGVDVLEHRRKGLMRRWDCDTSPRGRGVDELRAVGEALMRRVGLRRVLAVGFHHRGPHVGEGLIRKVGLRLRPPCLRYGECSRRRRPDA